MLAGIEQLWHEEVPGVALSAAGNFLSWQKNVHGIAPTTETMLLFGKAWMS